MPMNNKTMHIAYCLFLSILSVLFHLFGAQCWGKKTSPLKTSSTRLPSDCDSDEWDSYMLVMRAEKEKLFWLWKRVNILGSIHAYLVFTKNLFHTFKCGTTTHKWLNMYVHLSCCIEISPPKTAPRTTKPERNVYGKNVREQRHPQQVFNIYWKRHHLQNHNR